MRELKLTVIINRPAHEIFDFTINPENTPKWISAVVKEQASESPAKLGTMFVMTEKDSNVHVKYTFKPRGDKQCELEYYVWVDSGDLHAPFTQDNLQKLLQNLKDVIEV